MATDFYASIDNLLGESRGRFFGHGYTECRQSLHDFAVDDDDGVPGFRWRGAVELPKSWSNKGGAEQAPHLSTIAVIELARQCSKSLDPEQGAMSGQRVGAIRSMNITAAKSPVAGSLSTIPIAGRLHKNGSDAGGLDLTIANMQIVIDFSSAQAADERLMGDRKQRLAVGEVLVHGDDTSIDTLVASALVEVLEPSSGEPWSAASCFAATLQLGQALLYRLDGIERAQTNRLWMKKTSIIASGRPPDFEGRQPIHVRLENARRYEKADGFWRRADIRGFIANMEVVCSMTHRLPT